MRLETCLILPPLHTAPHPCPPPLAQVMEGANVEVDEAAEERKGGAGDLGKVGGRAGGQWEVAVMLDAWQLPALASVCVVCRDALRMPRREPAAAAVSSRACQAVCPIDWLLCAPYLTALPCPAGPQCFLSAGDKQLALYFHLPKALAAAKGLTLKEWASALLAPVAGHQVRGRVAFSLPAGLLARVLLVGAASGFWGSCPPALLQMWGRRAIACASCCQCPTA